MKQSMRTGLVVALMLGLMGSGAALLTPQGAVAQDFGQNRTDDDLYDSPSEDDFGDDNNYQLYDEQYRGFDDEDDDLLGDDWYDSDRGSYEDDRGWGAQETRWWEEHPYYNEDEWYDPTDWFDGNNYELDEDAYQSYRQGEGYNGYEADEGYEY